MLIKIFLFGMKSRSSSVIKKIEKFMHGFMKSGKKNLYGFGVLRNPGKNGTDVPGISYGVFP